MLSFHSGRIHAFYMKIKFYTGNPSYCQIFSGVKANPFYQKLSLVILKGLQTIVAASKTPACPTNPATIKLVEDKCPVFSILIDN